MIHTVQLRKAQFRFIPTCVGQISDEASTLEKVERFIPTCVGQMPEFVQPTGGYDAVHPHMRGADSILLAKRSSALRFIPTCVGQMGAITD